MPSFSQTPDQPEPFGYKILWFAIRGSDPAAVVDALELGEATPANWASGLEAAHEHDASQGTDAWVFVSPPVNGWILAVSWFPYPVGIEAHHDIGRRFDVLFSRLMKRFDDVQFFGSHRVVDFVTWARALKGKPVRVFGFADGQVLANVGEQTSEEAKLGFANLDGLSPSDATDKIFDADAIPDEEDVVRLTALWSVDPTKLPEQDHPLGLGLAARLPRDLMQ